MTGREFLQWYGSTCLYAYTVMFIMPYAYSEAEAECRVNNAVGQLIQAICDSQKGKEQTEHLSALLAELKERGRMIGARTKQARRLQAEILSFRI